MSISSKPKHGEPIANVSQSPLPGGGLEAVPTRQFQEFIDDIGDVFDAEEAGTEEQPRPDSLVLAQLSELRAQVGSGNQLTSDETGFTVDSDRLSVDMDEA